MAPKELLALRLLMDNPHGLYASELVHQSKGALVRGTVYVLLERLSAKHHVREVAEEPTPALALRRTRYFVTPAGTRACEDFARQHGLRIDKGALASR